MVDFVARVQTQYDELKIIHLFLSFARIPLSNPKPIVFFAHKARQQHERKE